MPLDKYKKNYNPDNTTNRKTGLDKYLENYNNTKKQEEYNSNLAKAQQASNDIVSKLKELAQSNNDFYTNVVEPRYATTEQRQANLISQGTQNPKAVVNTLDGRLKQDIASKYADTNAYKNDTQAVLDTTKKVSANNTATANEINALLEKYKEYYNEDFVSTVKDSLANGTDSLASIEELADAQNKYWGQWKNESEYKNSTEYETRVLEESALNDVDFDKYSQLGLGYENPSYEIGKGRISVDDGRKHAEIKEATPINNIVTFNRQESGLKIMNVYDEMTEDEVAIYSYYLAKENEGLADKGTAQRYLDLLMPSLETRQGAELAESAEGYYLAERLFGVAAGLVQYVTGIEGAIDAIEGKDIGRVSSLQVANSMMNEDLANSGFKVFGKSSGQIANDLLTTTANQVPTYVLASFGAGKIGTALMGISAGGNAYNSLIEQGYTPNQARIYGLLTGISETTLQDLIGGLPGVKSVLSDKALGNFTSSISNAGLRAVATIGGQAVLEGNEEFMQDILDPIFKLAITNDWDGIDLEEALYSGMIGALSSGAASSVSAPVQFATNIINAENIVKEGNAQVYINYALENFDKNTAIYKLAQKASANPNVSNVANLISLLSTNVEASKLNEDEYIKGLIKSSADIAIKEELAKTGVDVNVVDALQKGNNVLDNTKVSQAFAPLYERAAKDFLLNNTYTPSAKGNLDNITDTFGKNSQIESIAKTQTETIADDNANVAYDNNGNAVTIAKATGYTNGGKELTFETSDGKKVSANNLEFADNNVGKIYTKLSADGVSLSGINEAVDIYRGMDTKPNIEEFVRDIDSVYLYGYLGNKYEKTDVPFKTLGEENKKRVYNEGRKQNLTEATTENSDRKGNDTKGKVKKGIVDTTSYVSKETMSKLSDVQKQTVEVAKLMSKALNINITFVESTKSDGVIQYSNEIKKLIGDKDANGAYLKNGRIIVDINAGINQEGIGAFTLGHELTHFIKAWDTAKFKVLADTLFESINIDPAVAKAQIERIAYKSHGKLSFADAYEEAVCNAMASVFTSESFAKSFSKKLLKQDKNLFEKFFVKLSDTWMSLRKALGERSLNAQTEQAEWLSDNEKAISKLADIMSTALLEAGENYNAIPADVAYEQTTPVDDTKFNERYAQEHIGKIKELFNDANNSSITLEEALDKYEGLLKMWHDINASVKSDFMDKWNNKEGSERAFTIFKAQMGYKYAVEFASICKKGIPLFEAIDQIVQKGVFDIIANENGIIDKAGKELLYNVLKENGFDIPCAICYVEQARQREGEIIKKFLDGYKPDRKYGWNETLTEIEDRMAKQGVKFSFAKFDRSIATDAYNMQDFTFTAEEEKAFEKVMFDITNDMVDIHNLNVDEGKSKAQKRPKLKDLSAASLKATLGGSVSSNLKICKILLANPKARFKIDNDLLYSSYTTENLARAHSDIYSLFNAQGGVSGYKTKQRGIVYWGDILAKGWKPNATKLEDGVRIQSNSDAQAYMMLDKAQMYLDLCLKGYYAQEYTKVLWSTKVLGLCGVKTNLSLIPNVKVYYNTDGTVDIEKTSLFAGLDEYGNPMYDDIEGINHSEAIMLLQDEKYSRNLGGCCIAYSDLHLMKLLDLDYVQLIIGFHDKSNDPEKRFKGAKYSKNYNGINEVQNSKKTGKGSTIHVRFAEYIGKAEKMLKADKQQALDILQKHHNSEYKNLTLEELTTDEIPTLAADLYLEWCAEKNYIPAYNISGIVDHKNYYKLLADFALKDSNGHYSPQKPVGFEIPEQVPYLNKGKKEYMSTTEYMTRELKAEMATLDNLAKFTADDTESGLYQQIKKEYEKETKKSARDSEYLELAKEPIKNEEQLKQMVEEEARKKGFSTLHLYHGTNNFGFSKIDLSGFARDAQAFFATESNKLAKSYASDNVNNNTRKISNVNPLKELTGKESIEDVAKAYNEQVSKSQQFTLLSKEANDKVNQKKLKELKPKVDEILKYSLNEKSEKIIQLVNDAINDSTKIDDLLDKNQEIYDMDNIYDEYNRRYESSIRWTWGDIRSAIIYMNLNKDVGYAKRDGEIVSGDSVFNAYNSLYNQNNNGVYDLFANLNNMYEYNADFHFFDSLPFPEGMENNTRWKTTDTDHISEWAKENGYDGVIFRNIYDPGQYASDFNGYGEQAGDVYAFFNPTEQVKSADPVTYDENGNVIPLSERFNKANDDIRYSARDSEGNQLSQEQIDYFKDSKVRDENGNLLKVYHGTDSEFFTYDISKAGKNGRANGFGFYFTPDKSFAEHYGDRVIEAYLDIKKPISNEKKTITLAETKKLINDIIDNDLKKYKSDGLVWQDSFISNYVYTYDMSRNEAVSNVAKTIYNSNSNDVNVIYEIATANGQNSSVEGAKAFYEVLTKSIGFDGGWYGKEIVIFNSNQAKLVDNKTPTDNDDIRYSTRSQALSDTDVLELAVDNLDTSKYTQAEKNALAIFKKKLDALYNLQTERTELGKEWYEYQFGENRDKNKAIETLNKMHILDSKITKVEAEMLSIKDKSILKNVLKRARKEVESSAGERYAELYSKSKERQEDNALKNKYKERIANDVETLSKYIERPDFKKGKYVADAVSSSVIEFLKSIDFTSKRKLAGGEATKNDIKFVESLAKLEMSLRNNPDSKELDSGFFYLSPEFMEMLNATVETINATYKKGNYTINEMSTQELKNLSIMVKQLKTYIKNMNEFHSKAIAQSVQEVAQDTIDTVGELAMAQNVGEIQNYAYWKMMRPAYIFDRFGEGGKLVFKMLQEGDAKIAERAKEIIDFSNKTYSEEDIKKWEKQKISVPGTYIKDVPLPYALGLYFTSQDADGQRHLENGGARFAIRQEGNKIIQSDTVGVSEKVIDALRETLKAEAPKAFEAAKQMQSYMASTGAKWLNEISQARYGVDIAKNPYYYPISSDGRQFDIKAEKFANEASMYALLNSSFQKQRIEKANNAVVIYDFFDVFANHMASVAQYNSYALPLLDAMKWLNFKGVYGSVQDTLTKAYGAPVEKNGTSEGYAITAVKNILKAYNGTESHSSGVDALSKQILQRSNLALVAFKLTVALKQPLSYMRAAQVIDYNSLLHGLELNPKALKGEINEMLEHNGMALWKNLGYFDVNISRGLTQQIKHDDTIVDKLGEIGMKLPELADTITWGAMWKACKYEVKKENPNLAVGSDAFFAKVNEKFNDLVYKTQVVDSVMTKNEFMRDKSFASKMFSSFMGEPMTAISPVADAIFKYQLELKNGKTPKEAFKKHQKLIGRTMLVYTVSAVGQAIVETAITAGKGLDDEEDKTKVEQITTEFINNLIDELVPFNKYPIIADLYEVFKLALNKAGVDTYGYEPSTVFTDLSDSILKIVDTIAQKIENPYKQTGYTWASLVKECVDLLSSLSGIAVGSMYSEVKNLWNATIGRTGEYEILDNYKTSREIVSKYRTLLKKDKAKAKSYYNELIELKKKELQKNRTNDGLKEYDADELQSKAESSIKSSITSALKSDYIKAYKDKDEETMKNIRLEMQASGLYGNANSILNTCKGWIEDYKK